MKQFIPFILIMLFVSTLCLGQTNDTLIIEVTTNDFGDETSWKLFDENDALITKRTSFGNESTHFDTVLLNKDLCYYWELYDSFGDGFQGSGAVKEGDFKLYLNGNLFAECENPAFGSKLAVYNVGSGCATNDIEVTEVAVDSDLFFGDFTAKAKILNVGGETFNSVTCFYTLNDFTSETVELELSLEPGKDTIIEYPVATYMNEAKDAQITFTVVNVNGIADAASENNTATKNVTFHNGFEQIIMHEIFTSSTCGPCAPAAEMLNGILKQHPGKYAVLKHQVNWPGAGDPYYNAEFTRPRVVYYGVREAPSFVINGELLGSSNNYSNSYFTSLEDQPSLFDIKVSGTVWGDSVRVEYKIVAHEDIPEDNNYILQANVVERETTKNKGTNGQTKFSHVMMSALPDSEGTPLGAMTKFEEKTFAFETSMSETFVEQMSDLKAVGFIQDNESKAVVQSKMNALEYLGAAPKVIFSFEDNSEFNINDTIFITSNQPLRNIDDTEIVDFNDIIELYKSGSKAAVNYTASINAEKTEILVIPEVALDYETEYIISISKVENEKNIAITKIEAMFTTIAEPVGIKNHLSRVCVYPNPATEVLNIENEIYKYVQVFDMTGKAVLFNELNKGLNTVNIQKLNQGIYIGVFQGEITSETIKLIIE